MTDWLNPLLRLLFVILLATLFISLGSKNWAKGYWKSLKFTVVIFVGMMIIVLGTVFSMIVLGKDRIGIAIGIMFTLFGVATVLSAQFINRSIWVVTSPRVQEIGEMLGTASQRPKLLRYMGFFLILIGLFFVLFQPFLGSREAIILLGWMLLVVINAGAGGIIATGLISALRMKQWYPEIGRADRDTLMALWPPIVLPVLGPIRTSDWEQFKVRLAFQIGFRFRSALLLVIPQQKIQRLIWLGLVLAFIAYLFLIIVPSSHLPSPFFSLLIDNKLPILVLWATALLVTYGQSRIGRRFMEALQARVNELDSS